MAPPPTLTTGAPPTPTLSTPASFLTPPPGVVPDFENAPSLAHYTDIALGVAVPLVTIFYALRCWARHGIRRVWIFEDLLVTVAWAGTIAYCSLVRTTMAHHGGVHGWDITLAQGRDAAYWFNVSAVTYGVMIGITKVAILCLYRRVFSPIRWARFDIVIVALMLIMIGFYGSTTFVKIFECVPRAKIFDRTIPGRCLEMRLVLNASGGFNMITDYILLLLPVRAVWKLQMQPAKRVMVVLAFTFGLCAPIFATVGFIFRLEKTGSPDTNWNQPLILLWGLAELASGVLCVCFPELAILLKRRGRLHASTPRRPTQSQVREWSDSKSRRSSKARRNPYFTTSIMNSVMSSRVDNKEWIELNEVGNAVQVLPMGTRVEDIPEDGVILMRNEVVIERQ